jgi:polyribonucleotide nucleotidyltransferase
MIMFTPLNKVINMEQQAEKAAKPAKTKSVSAMRKITSELDMEVRKVETNKIRLTKLEKTISDGNTKIRALTVQLSKHFA